MALFVFGPLHYWHYWTPLAVWRAVRSGFSPGFATYSLIQTKQRTWKSLKICTILRPCSWIEGSPRYRIFFCHLWPSHFTGPNTLRCRVGKISRNTKTPVSKPHGVGVGFEPPQLALLWIILVPLATLQCPWTDPRGLASWHCCTSAIWQCKAGSPSEAELD